MRTFEEIHAEITSAFNISDADTLLRTATELEALATPQARAMASGYRGWALYLRGEYLAALEHSRRALAIHEELGDRSGLAKTTGNIGNILISVGDYPAALEHLNRALAINEELDDLAGVASVTGSIGIVYRVTGDYPKALEHYYRSLALHEELGERRGVANVTGSIGLVHQNIGDYPESLSHFQRALALHEELGNRSAVAIITSNIGLVHSTTGDSPAALEHYHRALAIHEDLGERNGVATATVNILAEYVSLESDAEAHELLQAMDSMHIVEPEIRITRDFQRATLQDRSGDLIGASLTLQNALAEALEHGLRSQAAVIHKAMRDVSQKQNDFAGYVEHNNEYTRISEEINGRETTLKLATQAKQREIDAVQRQHAQHMAVLHSTLPKHIADRVARGEVVNDHYDNAAVIFLDIVGFTTISDQLSSTQVVQLLESVFTTLDAVCDKHNVVKIKTIGDSYMAVAFPTSVPHSVRNDTSSLDLSTEERVISSEARNVAEQAASTALDMLHAVSHIVSPVSSPEGSPEGSPLQVRIGMHTGPVTAGVIGTQRMQYDVWGDTVNVASRMESTGEPGRIHVSSSFALALKGEMEKERNGETDVIPSMSTEHGTRSQFPVPCSLIERGALEIKGKGTMQTYWLGVES